MNFHGLEIVIEHKAGDIREYDSGYMALMFADYGFIKDSVSAEPAEELDVLIGPDLDSEKVFFADILRADLVDVEEAKVLIGFEDSLKAWEVMHETYNERFSQRMVEVTIKDLKDYVALFKDKARREKVQLGEWLAQRVEKAKELKAPDNDPPLVVYL